MDYSEPYKSITFLWNVHVYLTHILNQLEYQIITYPYKTTEI